MALQFNRLMVATLVASSSAWLLTSCQVTAAQNEPLTAVAKIEPAAVPVVMSNTGRDALPRSMWVWDATVISNPQQATALLDFCAKKGMSRVYLSMGDIFTVRQRDVTDPKHTTAAMLSQLLSTAHARHVEVEAVDGDPSFSLEEHHAETLARLQKALDYNKTAPANAKLDGFQWDTEPYILPEFKAGGDSRKAVMRQYLDSAAQMRDAVLASPSLRLGYAIPSFFDDEQRMVEWHGVTKPVGFHLMDILNTLPSSYVAIMAYRDKALGPNGTIAISTGEADYATKSAPKVKIWIGQETLLAKGDPPSISFWEEGENPMEQAIGQIQTAFKDEPAVAGIAIHHWASYRVLKPGDLNYVAPPITEPFTILSPQADDAVERKIQTSGTAKPGGAGVKVAVSVRSDGDAWYPQGEFPVGTDGLWSITTRFGNADTPAGRSFEVRAQLLKADGTPSTEQIVKVKTK